MSSLPCKHGVTALQTLKDLGTTYLDLMLLHYPECWGTLCKDVSPQGTWKDSWRAFEHAVDQGKLRAIGELACLRVSCFSCTWYGDRACPAANVHVLGPIASAMQTKTPNPALVHPGVSNFDMVQLNELRSFARIQPAVVQRNSDPFSQDAEMRAYCRIAGIQYQV